MVRAIAAILMLAGASSVSAQEASPDVPAGYSLVWADEFAGEGLLDPAKWRLRVVLFSLPGAFTPTCTTEQCPAFEAAYDEIRLLGVDEVYCLSVNDAFVMYQWAKHLGLRKLKLLPDGSGFFTRRMGMLVKKDHLGFGERSWRYAAVIDDGVVTAWFEEPGINDEGTDDDPYGASAPDKVIDWLENNTST